MRYRLTFTERLSKNDMLQYSRVKIGDNPKRFRLIYLTVILMQCGA